MSPCLPDFILVFLRTDCPCIASADSATIAHGVLRICPQAGAMGLFAAARDGGVRGLYGEDAEAGGGFFSEDIIGRRRRFIYQSADQLRKIWPPVRIR